MQDANVMVEGGLQGRLITRLLRSPPGLNAELMFFVSRGAVVEVMNQLLERPGAHPPRLVAPALRAGAIGEAKEAHESVSRLADVPGRRGAP
jgi:hypothetical protein